LIEIWVLSIIAISFFGVSWYFLNTVAQIFAETMIAAYPAYFTNSGFTLVLNLMMWLGAIFMFGLLVWVIINSRKPELPYVYA